MVLSILETVAANENWIEQKELTVSKCVALKANNKNCKHRSKIILYTCVLLLNSVCSD
jgi:hypothetical protein